MNSRVLRSDRYHRSRRFTGHVRVLLKYYAISSTPYHSRMAQRAEQVTQEVRKSDTTLCSNSFTFQKWLPSYRNGYLPSFHRIALLTLSQYRNDIQEPSAEQAEIYGAILQNQRSMKEVYNKRHYKEEKYDLGEVVMMLKQPTVCVLSKLLYNPNITRNLSRSSKFYQSGTYRVSDIASYGSEMYASTTHVFQLKLCKILKSIDDGWKDEKSNDIGAHACTRDEPRTNARAIRLKRTPAYLDVLGPS